jgi:hypothetical protein
MLPGISCGRRVRRLRAHAQGHGALDLMARKQDWASRLIEKFPSMVRRCGNEFVQQTPLRLVRGDALSSVTIMILRR